MKDPVHGAPGTWLFVDAIPYFGGHEVMLLRWLEEMERNPTLVTPRLLAREGGKLLDSASPAVRCMPFAKLSADTRWRRVQDMWREWRLLADTVRRLRPECVMVASGALGYQISHVLLLRLLGARVMLYVPLLGTFESMEYRLGAWKDAFVRRVYAKVPRAWVAISETQAQEFRAWAQPTGKVFVLPNTVSPMIEHAPRVPPRALAPEQALRVLLLGRLDHHQKGLDMLLAHLAQAAPAQLDGLHFRFVGDGAYKAHIEALLRARPALVPHIELQAWGPAHRAISEADVLLLTSRYEGVPLVMLEAMALGVPVVAPDLPGTRPYVPSAVRFPVGDMQAALEMLRGLRPMARRQSFSQAGRECFDKLASGRAFEQHVFQLVRDVRAHFSIGGGNAYASPLGPVDTPTHTKSTEH